MYRNPPAYPHPVATNRETLRQPDRTYRLGLTSLVATLLLIMVGGFTRGSGSGYGCADRWPLCENGLLGGWLPRADYHMIIEWSHRWLAATVGVLAIATALSAWRRHRDDLIVPVMATAAVATILFQAWIGRAIVRSQLDADLVSLHLAISLTVAAFLTITVVTLRSPRGDKDRVDMRWVWIVAAGGAGVFVVIMLGSLVHNLYFPGWPLMFDELLPDLGSQTAAIHFVHRLAAGLYLVVALVLWTAARKQGRPRVEVVMLGVAALLYAANVGIGATHVFTRVSSAALVALHLGLASTVWVLMVATAASAGRTSSIDTSQLAASSRSS